MSDALYGRIVYSTKLEVVGKTMLIKLGKCIPLLEFIEVSIIGTQIGVDWEIGF